MRDADCVGFLQWALPELGLRWTGFRRVRRQVCKRVVRRVASLGLTGLDAYRDLLVRDPAEWRVLDRLCRVTISRLWRDRATFAALESTVLPPLAHAAVARGRVTLDVWSCGCASGEEAHSLAILWSTRVGPNHPSLALRLVATDVDMHLLVRAGRAVYPEGATREVPDELAAVGLEPVADGVRVAARFRAGVHRVLHDVRDGAPGGPFDLILCRNLVFTYFEEELQRVLGASLVRALRPGGALVLGGHEVFPSGVGDLEPWGGNAVISRRCP